MRDFGGGCDMRTTRAIALKQHKSLGDVVSDLARRVLHRPRALAVRNGVPLLPMNDRKAVVASETVNALRDALP